MSAPAGALSVFPHCRSSVCSRRSTICISPLPQQCLLPQERYLFFLTAAAVPAPAEALSVFPHCRSSARSSRSLFPPGPSPPLPVTQIPSPFHHPIHPQRPIPFPNSPTPPQESPPAVFFTAAAVPAPAGTFSIFPHCRSSARSSRSLFSIFPHCRSSACSRRSAICISHCLSSICSRRSAICIAPLPQQCLLPQEPYLYFPTAAAVSAPAGALSVFPHCRSSARSSRSLFSSRPLPSPVPKSPPSPFHHPQRPISSPFPNSPTPPQESPPAVFFTAAAVPAPAGAFSIFLHCCSSDCSRRSAICISPLPQQCPLQQEPFLFFPTAAAVPAPAGAFSIFLHWRSSDCSRRSAICISPLPQ